MAKLKFQIKSKTSMSKFYFSGFDTHLTFGFWHLNFDLGLLSPVSGNSSQRGLSLKFTQLIFKIPDCIVDPNQFRARPSPTFVSPSHLVQLIQDSVIETKLTYPKISSVSARSIRGRGPLQGIECHFPLDGVQHDFKSTEERIAQ
jgi:hypothetical protein